MINLVLTTDKLQVVTGQASDLDVHVSFMDYTTATGAILPGKQNATITTAATTDVCGAPASGHVINIKNVNIRNAHATASCDVTVQFNANATIYELIKVTLAPGDTLEYSEATGWFKIPNPVLVPGPNVSTADQSIGASVTNYLTNSDLRVSAGRPLKVGTVLLWHVVLSKSGAGTVSCTFDLRVGTAGTTGDTSRGSLATGTQTGVADNAELEVSAVVRSISATGTIHVGMQLQHNLAATGWGPTNVITSETTSGTFDTTATNLIFGLSLTTGASYAVTVKHVRAEFQAGTI